MFVIPFGLDEPGIFIFNVLFLCDLFKEFFHRDIDDLDVVVFLGLLRIDIRGDQPVGRFADSGDLETVKSLLGLEDLSELLDPGYDEVIAAVDDLTRKIVLTQIGQNLHGSR